MLIRKPVAQVFEAFIDPAVTTQVWFTKSSGKLETGKILTWEWEMYGASAQVLVKEMQPNERIVIEWGEPATTVAFNFKAVSENKTYVVIRNWGFRETGDALLHTIKDVTGGFTTVLDGCKAFLEHGINLNLIADKFPEVALEQPGKEN
jgi:uncharacterized protein YndB with AHSA1/START domain